MNFHNIFFFLSHFSKDPMTNLLCFKWVNLQKDSRFNFYVTVPKINSMPLTPSQRSASKLKTTHSLYELLAHAVYLKKKKPHTHTPNAQNVIFKEFCTFCISASNTPDGAHFIETASCHIYLFCFQT